jgi:hypothetical protein
MIIFASSSVFYLEKSNKLQTWIIPLLKKQKNSGNM